MPLDISFVAYGPVALDALGAAIAAAKGGDPLGQVTVVVPSALAGLSARRALSRRELDPRELDPRDLDPGDLGDGHPGVAAVTFLPLVRLAELVGAPALAAAGRRPVTGPVAVAAVRAQLRAEPGPWSAVGAHPATERAMAATVADVRRGDEATIDALIARGGSVAAVGELVRAVGQRLAGWYDDRDLYRAAAASAAQASAVAGPVVVWLPTAPLGEPARAFLQALGAAGEVQVIVGLTGGPGADAPALELAHLLGGSAVGAPRAAAPVDAPSAVLVSPDADEEARVVARRVAAWFAEGVPLHRMAVFHPANTGAALLLHQHLRAAGLPSTGPDPRRLRDALAPRVLLELLALPDSQFARDEVIALLAAAPVLRADHKRVPFTRWDMLSREAGVVRGLVQWPMKLTTLSESRRLRARELEDLGEASPARLKHLRDDADQLDELLEFVEDLARRLDPPEPDTWTDLTAWCGELLKRFLGGQGRRAGWPERELAAADQLDRALDILASLDDLAVGGALPPRVETLRHLLEVELDRPAGRIGRFGEGVLVAPMEAAPGLDLDRVIVTGMAEGVWPHRPGDDPLLPDRVRTAVGLGPRGVPIDEQHRRLLTALAVGGDDRLVSFPTGDLRSGRTFEPSRWIDLASAEQVESFAAGLRSRAEPSGLADLDLRLLVAATDRSEALAGTSVVAARPELAAGLHVRAERAREAFTRFDGNVGDGIAAAHLDERLLSPTSLERYAGCPFRYLLTNVLRVGAVERPEELDDMSPMDKGSLVHEVLEHFVGEVLERPAGDQPDPDEPWTPADHARVDELFDAVAARYETEGRTGRWLRWQHTRDGLRRALHAFLLRDDQYRRAEGARPAAAEMTFGNAHEAAVEVRVGDRVLRFHGQADRIDRAEDGSVVVIDYKVANPKYWEALKQGDPVQRGQRLQLPIYALAARQRFGVEAAARAGYVFIHDEARPGLVGYEVDDARFARFREVVGVLADGITAGVFPPHPGEYQSYWGTHANCTFCDYDRLCPPDRGDQWQSVEEAPELAAFVELVEGDDPWEDAEEDGEDGEDREDSGCSASAELSVLDERARAAIDRDLDATLFVDAGAGSGKTTHLVRRVVALVVDEGVPLQSLAAITFTEAAAAELRHRVRAELLVAAGERDDADARRRAQLAVAEVDHAPICTLHAFAQRILAEFPIEAGLPPVIEVLDEIRSDLAFDERWRAFLDDLYDDPSAHPWLLQGFVVGIDEERLRGLAKVLDDNHDRLEDVVWPEPTPESVEVDALLAQLDGVLDRADECGLDDDTMVKHLETTARAFRDRLQAAPDDLGRLAVLIGQKRKVSGKKKGRATSWPGDCLAEVRAGLDVVQAERDGALRRVTAACLAELARRVAAFTRASASARRRDGTLEFHDLLVFSRQLLRGNAGVRAILHERYRCLLLDEFQDTDPLQIELAALIATDAPDVDEQPWSVLPVGAGRLFFVGDPKQSIYRFRRADIQLFLEAQAVFAPEATVLARNFRSVPSVIEFVNGFFGELFGAGEENAQPPYAPLLAERLALDGTGPAVWLCGGPEEALPAEPLRELEATAVAAAIRAILDEEWPVVDGASIRAARPDDIAVLLPARTPLPYLESALRAQRLPYRAETGSLVWSTREVQELLTVLRAIDDPSDEIALVAALRSPAFACGDDDLLSFHGGGGRWTVSRPPPEDMPSNHPVVMALEALRALHDERWWLDVAGLVERVVRDRGLLELALADDRPRDTWRRLRYVCDQARAYTESVGGTLRGFLDWAERQRSDTASVAAPVLPEADDRAVRILTMHGAKGLEFPIAVLSGLTTVPAGGRRGVQVLWRGGDQPPDLRIASGVETDNFDQRRTAEEQLDQYERLRLFYVAMTRARDHLVVATHHKPATGEHRRMYAQLVWDWANDQPTRWQTGIDGWSAAQPPDVPSPWEVALPSDGALPERSEWWSAREQRLAASHAPAIAATAVAERAQRLAAEPAELVPEEADEGVDPTRPPWAKGRGGTAFGRAVHAVLQTVDLATGADLEAIARAQATAEGVPGREAEVAARVRAALEAAVVRQAVAGRYWRELYVGAPVGDIVVEGFVDLLVETPDGLLVVDYKTDSVRSEGEIERAYRRYRLQGAAYALALQEHLGRPVAGARFLFLTPDGARERAIDDLEAAVAEVRQVVGA